MMSWTVGATTRCCLDARCVASIAAGRRICHWTYLGVILDGALDPDRVLIGRLRCVIELVV